VIVSDRLVEVRLDLAQRIEGSERILKDRLDLLWEPFAAGAIPDVTDVTVLEQQVSTGWLDQSENHPRQCCLATPAFTGDG
jgi:hypothetical protein